MMLILPIKLPSDEISDFCDRWQVRELALFGSVLRDDFRPDSDIDILIAFSPQIGACLTMLEWSENSWVFSDGKWI